MARTPLPRHGMGMPRDEDNIARLKRQIENIQRSLERARAKAAS